MKKTTLILINFLFVFSSFSQAVLQFVKSLDLNSPTPESGLTNDKKGNIYLTGDFRDTVDFDPGPGVAKLAAKSTNGDVFVAKYDPNGLLLWVVSMGGAGNGCGKAVSVDEQANVYTMGVYSGTVDFRPGVGTFSLTGGGIFISKLDSNGNFIWAKKMGNGGDEINSMAIDNGFVYSTGSFKGSGDFDPDASNSYVLTAASTGYSNFDVYISKIDTGGNFKWAKRIGGSSIDEGRSIAIDQENNVIITGEFSRNGNGWEVDFDPGIDTFNMISYSYYADIFISKLDSNGNFVWARDIGGTNDDRSRSVAVDNSGSIYITGNFSGTADFDPSSNEYDLTGITWINYSSGTNVFFLKLDKNGDFNWVKSLGKSCYSEGLQLFIDKFGYVFVSGTFNNGTADLDIGPGTYNVFADSIGTVSYIIRFSQNGQYNWAGVFKGTPIMQTTYICNYFIDDMSNLCVFGFYNDSTNFEICKGQHWQTGKSFFLAKYKQNGIWGEVFNDLNENCNHESNESDLPFRRLILNPGNKVIETSSGGYWNIDSLAPNTYTLTIDTSGKQKATCSSTQQFTITNSDTIYQAPGFGLKSTEPCSAPEISIYAPSLRRCFTDQNIYIEVKNLPTASNFIDSAYVELTLDSLIKPTSASIPYSVIGNNKYKFQIGRIYPYESIDFKVATTVSCNVVFGQTLCMKAIFYPVDSCIFDTIPSYSPNGSLGCLLPWGGSNITVDGYCKNDSIYFVIKNTAQLGIGNMNCYSHNRIYIDGQLIKTDSILLNGGESDTLIFKGDGRTWRIEVDQHPKHPGNSHPNATIERCGAAQNWTKNLVNILPQDDGDPNVDIYCGVVSGSFDPNQKTGFPLGVTSNHLVEPNGKIDFVVQFQNTGTDTAFTVVIRDTLDTDLDIFSVYPGVSSHNYTFRMYGPRVLEWTFDNILLPDSSRSEQQSHGFVCYSANQNKNLANGVIIKNSASIYFDYNAPVITNYTSHIISDKTSSASWEYTKMLSATGCDTITVNGIKYLQSGTYWQVSNNNSNQDTLLQINTQVYTNKDLDLLVSQSGNILTSHADNASYQWLNCAPGNSIIQNANSKDYTITKDGYYAVIISQFGCTDTSYCNLVIGTGLQNMENAKFMFLYPNPSDNNILVTVSGIKSDDISFTFSDISGKQIKDIPSKNISSTAWEFNIQQLSKGFYTINLNSSNKVLFQAKFVKN